MSSVLVPALLVGAGILMGGLVVRLWPSRPRAGAHRPVEESSPDRSGAFAARPVLDPRVDALLAQLPGVVVVVDPSDAVVRSSGPARALGLVRGQGVVPEQLRDLVRRVRRDGAPGELMLTLPARQPGEAQLPVAVRAVAAGDDLVVVLGEDRTAVQRVEATRRDFVVNISHELKTPVGGLILLAEAVEDARDDPQAVARFASRMQVEARRLGQLVAEIIDLSRLQVADVVSDPEPVRVNECVRRARDEVRVLAEGREISVVTSQDPTEPVVHGDLGLLVTAVRNLLTNAITYSEPHTRVTVTVRHTGDEAEVVVADQGIGIAPADQERVFERFFRVDEARSRATGGTGLGLAIVKHVAVNHGGRVSVWSEEGHGSTFVLRLPAVPADQLTPDPPTGALAP